MNFQSSIAKDLLSLGGVGFLPLAPGTWGSVVAGLLLYGLHVVLPSDVFLRTLFLFVLLLGTFGMGIILLRSLMRDNPSSALQESKNDVDQPWIVLDELVGMVVACGPLFFVVSDWPWWGLAFVLFRGFDIVKPLGIKSIDSRKTVGSVFLDDVVAGVYAAGVLMICLYAL